MHGSAGLASPIHLFKKLVAVTLSVVLTHNKGNSLTMKSQFNLGQMWLHGKVCVFGEK